MIQEAFYILPALAMALAVFFYIGLSSRALGQYDEGFWFADRNVGAWGFGFTWFASVISFASGILYYMQIVPQWGYWVFIGSIATYAIGQFFAVYIATTSDVDFKRFRTVGHLVDQRLNAPKTSLTIGVFNFLALGALVYIEIGLGVSLFVFLAPEAGVAAKYFAFFVISAIVYVYIYFGGFRAVVASDGWQSALIVSGLVALVAFIGVQYFADGTNGALKLPEINLTPAVGWSEVWPYLVFGLLVNGTALLSNLSVWQRFASAGSSVSVSAVATFSILVTTIVFVLYILIAGVLRADGINVQSPAALLQISVGGDELQTLLLVLTFVGLFAALISSADSSAIAAMLALFAREDIPDEDQEAWKKKKQKATIALAILLFSAFCGFVLSETIFQGFFEVFLNVIFFLFSVLTLAFPVLIVALRARSFARSDSSIAVGLVVGFAILAAGSFSPLFGDDIPGALRSTAVAVLVVSIFTVRLRKAV